MRFDGDSLDERRKVVEHVYDSNRSTDRLN
jgi:hypothetical protein